MHEDVTPPEFYGRFIAEFPLLAQGWATTAEAGAAGPIDARTGRLVKLAAAIAAGWEGAVRSSVRKARAEGISRAEIMQVLALTAGTIGFPAAAAGYDWIESALASPD